MKLFTIDGYHWVGCYINGILYLIDRKGPVGSRISL